jgi:hypothetical protein
MGKRQFFKGREIQGEHPDWRPLLTAVGQVLAADFMWMYEVRLADGRLVQAYKHRYTRCYVHLAADGTAFVYEPSSRYRVVRPVRAFMGAFGPLPELGGATEAQVEASWAAMDRLDKEAVYAAEQAASLAEREAARGAEGSSSTRGEP